MMSKSCQPAFFRLLFKSLIEFGSRVTCEEADPNPQLVSKLSNLSWWATAFSSHCSGSSFKLSNSLQIVHYWFWPWHSTGIGLLVQYWYWTTGAVLVLTLAQYWYWTTGTVLIQYLSSTAYSQALVALLTKYSLRHICE